MVIRTLHIVILAVLWNTISGQNEPNKEPYHMAETLDYSYIFNKESDVSVIILACSGIRKLQIVLKTFFYFNTYILNKIYIAHCSTNQIPLQNIMSDGYVNYRQFFQIVQAKDKDSGLIDALQEVYKMIQTKYVYQTDDLWAMVKGFGFIEQAISVLKDGEDKKQNISQVVSNYPIWRINSYLSQMYYTKQNIKYHKIASFNKKKYLHYTLSPSVYKIETIYQKILEKKIKQKCIQLNCSNIDKYQFDKCCIWNIGQICINKQYYQVYLNDGSSQPNHQFIKI